MDDNLANGYDHDSRILLDASARRFRAEKICRQATAATRWVNVRNSILKGQRPHVGHAYQLMHCDQALENVGHLLPHRCKLQNSPMASSKPNVELTDLIGDGYHHRQ